MMLGSITGIHSMKTCITTLSSFTKICIIYFKCI
jgi:hypothetical protein